MKKIFIALVSASFLMQACEENDNAVAESKAVVEAYLQPDTPVNVKISREFTYGETSSASNSIDNLTVTIIENGISYTLTQDANGVYQNPNIIVVAGNTYELNFVYNNQTVSATTQVPTKPINFTATADSFTVPIFDGRTIPEIPEPIKLKWDNPNNDYHFFTIKSITTDAEEIATNGGTTRAIPNTPDQGDDKEINFRNFKYYGTNALLLYKVQPEYVALYNSGGDNSQNLTTVPTNVSNGLGIFTSVNVADSLFVEVK
jgi:Domain of unknown function (DUF4249)